MDTPVTCQACGELNLVSASTLTPSCRRCRKPIARSAAAVEVGTAGPKGYGRALREPEERAAAAPAAATRVAPSAQARLEPREFRDASRLARLGGFLIDTSFTLLIFAIVFIPRWPEVTASRLSQAEIDITTPVLIAVVLAEAVQAVLLVRRGQTIGKLPFRMQIVDLQGRIPGFYRVVIARRWGQMLIQAVVPIYELIDALFIFGSRRRCLHDRMAGTRVISLR